MVLWGEKILSSNLIENKYSVSEMGVKNILLALKNIVFVEKNIVAIFCCAAKRKKHIFIPKKTNPPPPPPLYVKLMFPYVC